MEDKTKFSVIILLSMLAAGGASAVDTEAEFSTGSFNLTGVGSPEINDELAMGHPNGASSDSLSAYWRFDESFLDYSGNGIDPIASENVIFEDGILNTSSAGFLLSEDSYVEYSDSPELNPETFTFSAWVNPTGSQDKIILEKSVASDRGYIFLIDNFYSQDRVALYLKSLTDGVQRFRSDTSLQQNTWQHIAATYNGTDVSLYINGSKQPLYSGESTGTYNKSSQDLIVGASSTTAGGDYYNGNLDELRIHSPYLTQEEIRKEYFFGKPFQGGYQSKNLSRNIEVDWFQAETTSSIPHGTDVNLSLKTNQSTGLDTQTKTLSGGTESTSFDLKPSKQAFFELKGITQSITETWGVDKVELDYIGAELVKPEEDEKNVGGNVDFTYNVDTTVPGTAYISVNGTDRGMQSFGTGQNTYTQYIDLDEGFYSSKVRLEAENGESFTTETSNFTHLNQTDFKVNRILFNRTDFVENAPTEASVNVSNLEPDPGQSEVEANFFYYRSGVWNRYKTSTEVFDSSGGDSARINFTFNPYMGPNRVTATADPEDNLNELDETNNQRNITEDVPLYSVFYGEATQKTTLTDFEKGKFYDFGEQDVNGTIYYADSDASFSFSTLEPLKDHQDLQELDNSLNSSGFNDSIQNTWGSENNQIRRKECFTISGTQNCNVPSVNSTQNSFFNTGILYDGGTTYQQGDPVTFISDVVPSRQGGYGIYDYEIKIPANLAQNSGPNEKLNVYLEIQ